MQASFAHTWRHETALTAGAGYTPNAFINTDDERLVSTAWQAKLLATLKFRGDFRVTPTIRHQAGNPFGRVFTQTFNWGNATVRAEPIDAQRMPNVNVFDIRTEKAFRAGPGRITGFFDVYNIFNTNAEQELDHDLRVVVAAADCDYAAADCARGREVRLVGRMAQMHR